MPVQVFTDLCLSLRVSGVPVVGQSILLCEILHDARTVYMRVN